MSEPELTVRDLSRRLRIGELPVLEPASDLWLRIAATRNAQLRRARTRRVALSISAAAIVVALAVAAGAMLRAPASDIDWQARAQALEMRLRALDAAAVSTADAGAPAEAELVRVDAALQHAYDGGADRVQLEALWKRRSELLGALLHARLEHAEISRI